MSSSESHDQTHARSKHADHSGISSLDRLLFRLIGVDASLLKDVPSDEHHQMRIVGWSLIAGLTFQLLCFTTGLYLAFEPKTALELTVIWAAALSVTSVFLAFDRMLIATHWIQQGEMLCRRHGIIVGKSSALNIFLKSAARIVMSMIAAWTFAVPVTLLFFHGDINSYLSVEHTKSNAELAAKANSTFETLLADVSSRIEATGNRITNLEAERKLRLGLQDENGDPELTQLLQRRLELQGKKDKAEEAFQEATADAAAEDHGVKLSNKHSGLRGPGDRYRFYNELAGQHSKVADATQIELQAVDQQVSLIRQTRSERALQGRQNDAQRLSSIDGQIALLQQTRASLADDFRQLQDGRQQWLTKFIMNDPAYVPLDSGLMARMTALAHRSAARPELMTFMLLMKLMIMAIEAAGPLTKILMTTPGFYAARVALRLHDELDNLKRSREETRHENARRRHEQENDLHRYAAQKHAQEEVQEMWKQNFHRQAAE